MVVVSVPANDKYQEFHDSMVEFKVNVHGAFQASTERFKWTWVLYELTILCEYAWIPGEYAWIPGEYTAL